MDVEGAHALVLPALQPTLKGVFDLAVFPQSFGTAGQVQLFIGPDALLGTGLAVLFDPGGWLSVDTVLHAQFAPVPAEAFLLVQGGTAGQNQQPGHQYDQATEFHGLITKFYRSNRPPGDRLPSFPTVPSHCIDTGPALYEPILGQKYRIPGNPGMPQGEAHRQNPSPRNTTLWLPLDDSDWKGPH